MKNELANLQFTVTTNLDKQTGIIQQELLDAKGRVVQWMMDTRNKQIHDSLVALGWTPPPETKTPRPH